MGKSTLKTGCRALACALAILAGSAHAATTTKETAANALRAAAQRLLVVRYRTEFLVRQFENVLRAKKDVELIDSPGYAQLLENWASSDAIVHDIERTYEALVSQMRAADGEQARRSAQILREFDRWLSSRSEADRLQLLDLVRRLQMIDAHRGTKGLGALRSTQPLLELLRGPRERIETRIRALDRQIAAKARASFGNAEPLELFPSGETPKVDVLAMLAPIQPSEGADGTVSGKEFGPGTFVLTFDDGPEVDTTARLRALLKAHSDPLNMRGAPATFFCVLTAVLAHPDVVAGTKADGFLMNNHSVNHPHLSQIPEDLERTEVVDSSPAFSNAFGYAFHFFRCPYGDCVVPANPVVRKMIADQGLVHAFWRIDSMDWSLKWQPQRIADDVTAQMTARKSGIILMHDIHEWSVDAVQLILEWIKGQNSDPGAPLKVRLLTLEDAISEINPAH